jgi:hypothetical protein
MRKARRWGVIPVKAIVVADREVNAASVQMGTGLHLFHDGRSSAGSAAGTDVITSSASQPCMVPTPNWPLQGL